MFRNITNWLINHLIGVMIAAAIIYIVFGFYFKGLWSSTAAAWVGNISVFVAILQLIQQHKDSVKQLEFEKEKQKPKAKVFVNYVKDEENDNKYIECSLVNVGYETGIYKFIGIYPSEKFDEVRGALGKIENNRMVDQRTFVESLRGISIQDFDTVASAEKLGPKAILPSKINGFDHFMNGDMMVAVFQDLEDKLYYKEFYYDAKTECVKQEDETKEIKIVD